MTQYIIMKKMLTDQHNIHITTHYAEITKNHTQPQQHQQLQQNNNS